MITPRNGDNESVSKSIGTELRLLLVGVEEKRRAYLADALSKYYACALDSANGLDDALFLLHSTQHPYHVVLINDSLSSNGDRNRDLALALMREVNDKSTRPQFVVYTNSNDGQMIEALEAGAFRYLHQPFETDELAVHIRQAAEYQQLRSADQERRTLELLMKISAKLLDSRDEQDVLDLILEGVQAIGLDRVRLYQFDDARKVFVERSSRGMDESFVGREWSVGEFPYFQILSREHQPLILKREPSSDSRFDEWLAQEGIREWISVLLILRGEIIGKLSADNSISGRPITEETLKPFGLFASQATVAIVNARLFSEAETKRRNLATLLEMFTQVNPSLNLELTLNAACKAAVELLGVNHSGLMLFEAGSETGRVLAEYPEIGTKGLIVPLRGVPAEERLLDFREPILMLDIAKDVSFAPVAKPLLDQGIESMMLVPIIGRDRLLGSLGLDTVGYPRRFSKDDVDLCRIFAAQVAVAIENAQLYEEVKKRAEALETLRNTFSGINSRLERNPVLKIIAKQAVDILKARGGGIYKYYPEREELVIVADYYKPDQVGKTLRLGEGMAGQLVKNGLPFMSVANYNEWPGRASIFADEKPFEAVLEVLIKWQGSVIGVLYVDDKAGRVFSRDDANALTTLANQSAIALATTELIANTEMLAIDQTRSERLEKLALATKEIVGDLAIRTLDDRLELIAKHASGILEAESSGVFLVRQKGFLSLEASYGHRDGGFQKGKSLAIRSGPKTGLTGHIAHQGEIFNARGDDLVHHYSVRGVESHHTPEKGLFSLLAIPLKKKVADHEELVGLLRVDNKRDRDGKVRPNIGFTKEDEWILGIFAEEIVVALENAELVERLSTERSRLRYYLRGTHKPTSSQRLKRGEFEQLLDAARLMASASDLEHVLSTVAEQARAMLLADACWVWSYNGNQGAPTLNQLVGSGFSERATLHIRRNASLFEDLARSLVKTGWLCHPSETNSKPDFSTSSISKFMSQFGWKSFQVITLRTGDESVGILFVCYRKRISNLLLEERRSLLENFATIAGLSMKKTRLLDQIRRANESARLIARVLSLGNTDEALSHIARGTIEVIGCDAVTLYTYDKIKRRLRHPPTSDGLFDPSRVLKYEATPESLLYKMLWSEGPYIATDVVSDPILAHSKFAEAEKIRSLLAIPLTVSEQKVGLMFINYRVLHHFSLEELDNVWLFAHQAGVVIYNAQVYEENSNKLKQRQALSKFSQVLLGSFHRRQTLERAVKTAATILHSEFCSIVSKGEDGRFVFDAVTGFRTIEAGDVLDSTIGSQTSFSIQNRKVVKVDDYAEEKRFPISPLISEYRIKSGLSAPMFRDGKVMGAMLVHTKLPRRFTDEDASLLSLIANQTAIAAHSAEQFEALEKRRAQLTALYEAVNLIAASFGRERTIVLNEIIEQAVICVKGSEEHGGFIGTVQLYNEANQELSINSVYPKDVFDEVVGRGGRVRPLRDLASDKIGIVGRAIVDKQPQLVPDVAAHPDYIECDRRIRSQLAVPLIDDDKILGVVNIESTRLKSFDQDDLLTLQALAKHIVIALKNSDQYLELRRTKGMVGSRTALAWMGMASSTWFHDIAKHASNIANLVMLLRRNLERASLSDKDRQLIEEKFSRIEAQSLQIKKKPITSPLSSDEGVSPVPINDFISQRVRSLSERIPYNDVDFEMDLHANPQATVRCNPEWLAQALDILVDNAVQAMEESQVCLLTIKTQSFHFGVELRLSDTGRGIPEEIRERLLNAPIEKVPSSRGFGIGLLIAQVIIETYGGTIEIEQTDPEGTTFLVRLPITEHVQIAKTLSSPLEERTKDLPITDHLR